MATITPEQLLAEIEDVLRSMPDRATIRHDLPENHSWLGRASAVVNLWRPAMGIAFDQQVSYVHGINAIGASQALKMMLTTLHRAQSELRLQTLGPLTTALGTGSVFAYFDEVRKVIEGAKADVLFVDPYLDAEFVSRYLPHITVGTSVRLLGRERMQSLAPAVNLLRQQNGLSIEMRSANNFHDRYVFVDGAACYQSGASFKDGAKKSPTTLTQIVDAFAAVQATYESLWANGTAHT
jgi:hypothetical protein